MVRKVGRSMSRDLNLLKSICESWANTTGLDTFVCMCAHPLKNGYVGTLPFTYLPCILQYTENPFRDSLTVKVSELFMA